MRKPISDDNDPNFNRGDLDAAAKQAGALAPVAGPLQVGSIGIDHSKLPGYTDHEFEVLAINGDKVDVRYLDSGVEKTYPLQAKQKMHDEIMRQRAIPPKIRGDLTVDDIDWDADGSMAWFLGWIAGPNGAFNIATDTPEKFAKYPEDKYHSLMGKVIEWKRVKPDSIAEAERWGARAMISWKTTPSIPDELARKAKGEGSRTTINSMGLMWALLEHGFDLTSEVPEQNVAKIRTFVPDAQKANFDNGVHGINQPELKAKPTKLVKPV